MCVGLWSGCDFTPCVTLYRDVLKSDSAMVSIPELDLELGHGTLGGVFTTVEGLLMKIHKALQDNNPFAVGDSATQHHSNKAEQTEIKAKFKVFLGKLEDFAKGVVLPFTLIVRDPLGNSFISAPLGSFLPPEMDKNITMTDFVRSFEDNEEFGLNDINTADYETGVTYDSHQQPDRLTHIMPKGPDHPTPFAAAVPDNTPNAVVFRQAAAVASMNASVPTAAVPSSSSEAGTTEAGGYWDLGSKMGWRARKPDEREIDDEEDAAAAGNEVSEEEVVTMPKRTFNESDKDLQFEAREEFGGFRPGFVFRLGALGLGYYEDRKVNV
jgi:hypothetical protein